MAVINVNTDNFSEEVLDSDKKVLVDFWADWCGPCKMMGPVVDMIAEEQTDIKVCKADIDAYPDLALSYKVMSIPTLILFSRGKEVTRSVGVISKSDILDMINR